MFAWCQASSKSVFERTLNHCTFIFISFRFTACVHFSLLANCAVVQYKLKSNKTIRSTVTGYQKKQYAHLSWSGGTEVPQRDAGAEPWWGLGAKPPEAIGTL